jgi:uncharacterized protein (TIGR02246 family)
MSDIEARIARLEAESQIRQLVARYCFTIDDRDLDGVAALFTEDAVVRSADGVMHAAGIAAILEQYRGRFAVLGVGAHYMHDIAIDFAADGEARGTVSGHAELWRNGTMMVAALRYADRYRATATGWRFAERVIQFLYYVPVEQYPGILGHADRNRAYADPRAADYPEALPSWVAYEATRKK